MSKTVKLTAQQLEAALRVADERRATLTKQLQTAQSNEAKAAAAFTAGQPGGDVIAATNTVISLERARAAVDQQLSTLRKELSAAQADELRERQLSKLEEFAKAGQAALVTYTRERAELAELMAAGLARMTAARQEMIAARAEFCEAVNQSTGYALHRLLSPANSSEAVARMESALAELLQALEQRCDLTAVLIADFLEGKTIADKPHPWPDVPVAQIVDGAAAAHDGRQRHYTVIQREIGIAQSGKVQRAGL